MAVFVVVSALSLATHHGHSSPSPYGLSCMLSLPPSPALVRAARRLGHAPGCLSSSSCHYRYPFFFLPRFAIHPWTSDCMSSLVAADGPPTLFGGGPGERRARKRRHCAAKTLTEQGPSPSPSTPKLLLQLDPGWRKALCSRPSSVSGQLIEPDSRSVLPVQPSSSKPHLA